MDSLRSRLAHRATSLVEEGLVVGLAIIGTALTVADRLAQRFTRYRNWPVADPDSDSRARPSNR